MAIKPTSVPSKRLATSINASSLTIQLNNILGWDGNALTSSDFGDRLFAVLRNDTNTLMELIELDPTTIANSSITILKRGLKFTGDLTTEVTANKLTWIKNETIVELGSDSPQLFQWLKEYIDLAVVAQGIPATDAVPGIVIEATQAQVDAGTDQETYNAQLYDLFPRPDKIRAKKYHDYIADAGASDDYAITVVPAITVYTVGQEFTFKANTANTGACTLNVCGLGAKTIKKNVSSDLNSGDILANQIVKVIYDGTNMQMVYNSQNIKAMTAGETITGATLPVPVFQNKTDNQFYSCDGNDLTKLKFIGFGVSNSTDNNSIDIQFSGIVGGFTGLDEGEKYYLSDTVGTISSTPGTYEILVGVAISQTELLIQKGKRFFTGTFSATSTGGNEVVTNETVTLGFRPNIIRASGYQSTAATTRDEVKGTWRNGVYQGVAIDQDGGAISITTSYILDLERTTGSPEGYARGTIGSVTDTGFVFTMTCKDGEGLLITYEVEGEL